MSLDQAGTTFGTWTDAEIASGEAGTTTLFEKLVQDLIAAANILNASIDTPWSGDDIRIHFGNPVSAYPLLTTYDPGTGTIVHDMDNHLYTLTTGGATDFVAIYTLATRRMDTVPTVFEMRIKNSAFSATVLPVIGFSADPTNNNHHGGAAAWFEKGTNSNTWLCKTISGGTIRTSTDNQAGNYVGWDILKIDFTATSAKFYINGTLVATHTATLPVDVPLYGMVKHGGTTGTVKVDDLTWKQTTNPVSA